MRLTAMVPLQPNIHKGPQRVRWCLQSWHSEGYLSLSDSKEKHREVQHQYLHCILHLLCRTHQTVTRRSNMWRC
jgi:hypothetical protein